MACPEFVAEGAAGCACRWPGARGGGLQGSLVWVRDPSRGTAARSARRKSFVREWAAHAPSEPSWRWRRGGGERTERWSCRGRRRQRGARGASSRHWGEGTPRADGSTRDTVGRRAAARRPRAAVGSPEAGRQSECAALGRRHGGSGRAGRAREAPVACSTVRSEHREARCRAEGARPGSGCRSQLDHREKVNSALTGGQLGGAGRAHGPPRPALPRAVVPEAVGSGGRGSPQGSPQSRGSGMLEGPRPPRAGPRDREPVMGKQGPGAPDGDRRPCGGRRAARGPVTDRCSGQERSGRTATPWACGGREAGRGAACTPKARGPDAAVSAQGRCPRRSRAGCSNVTGGGGGAPAGVAVGPRGLPTPDTGH